MDILPLSHEYLHLIIGALYIVLGFHACIGVQPLQRSHIFWALAFWLTGIPLLLASFIDPLPIYIVPGFAIFTLTAGAAAAWISPIRANKTLFGMLLLILATGILPNGPIRWYPWLCPGSLGLIALVQYWQNTRIGTSKATPWSLVFTVLLLSASLPWFVQSTTDSSIILHILQACLLLATIILPSLLASTTHESLRPRPSTRILIATASLLAILTITAIYHHVLQKVEENRISQFLQRAEAISASVPDRWMDSLQGDLSDIGRLEHDMLRHHLQQVLAGQVDLRNLFILQQRDSLVFLVDEEYQTIANPESAPALPGEIYPPIPHIDLSLIGESPQVIGPFHNQRGDVVTAFVPILENGAVEYIFGVEMDAQIFSTEMATHRKPLEGVSILIVILFGSAWLIYLRTRQIAQSEFQIAQRQARCQEELTRFAAQSFPTLSEACRHANQLASEMVMLDAVSIWLYEGSHFLCMDSLSVRTGVHREDGLLPIEDHQALLHALKRQRQIHLRTLAQWVPQEDWQILSPDVQHRLDTALFQEGSPIGFLRMESKDPRWDWKGASPLASSLANLLTVLIEREIRHRIAEDHAQQSIFLNRLLDNLPVAVMARSTQEERYVIWNQNAERLTGISATEALGKTERDIFPEEPIQSWIEAGQRAKQQSEPLRISQVNLWNKSVTMSLLHLPGKFGGLLLTIATDISDQVAASCELQEANQRLESALQRSEELAQQAKSANEAKSQFLAAMSHEIRTPMNGVLGMLRLLQDSPMNEEQKEFCELARSSAESLLSIINEILDFSRIESGRLQLDLHVFEFRRMIQEVIRLFDSQAKERGIQLILQEGPDLPDYLIGDSTRFRQILTNLIGNAIKFTPQGEVHVGIRLVEQNTNSMSFHFTIRDTGIGIPANKHSLLFQPFTQADNSLVRRFGGTGLGLAITKHLVEMMGGSIGFTSQEGQGSTFWFDLTLQTETTHDLQGIATSSLLQIPLTGRILVAEDNTINQKLITKLLDRLHLQSQCAENGEIALEMLRSSHFDLVLMDVQMPVMDGYQATQQIRAGNCGSKNKDIPVIAVTAMILNNDRSRCLASGMNDYVGKPIQFDQLRSTLQRYLAGR